MKAAIKRALTGLSAASGLLTAGVARAVGAAPGGPEVNELNLQTPVTSIAREVYSLHTLLLVICLAIFVGVFGIMLYSIIMHRKSRGHKAANFHESTTVEIMWTIVPFLIIIGMAIPATKTVIAMKDTSNADLTIKVTGYQWKWGYDYLKGPGEGISLISTLATPREQIAGAAPKTDTYLQEVDHPLVVPVNRKIRIVTTAADVIHSWYVPAFGVKQDAFPGFTRDTWFTAEKVGIYRGFCTELCGKEHAFMPVVVNVVSEPDYMKWVDAQRSRAALAADDPDKTYTLAELTQRGEKVFTANCAVCHQASGKGVGPFPALDGSALLKGAARPVVDLVLHGRGQMPAWKNAMNDVEIASVVTYSRNAWGNHAGDVVQPVQVRAAREGVVGTGAADGAAPAPAPSPAQRTQPQVNSELSKHPAA